MRCEWQVEINPFCQRVLAKHWPEVRRWDDVRTFPPEGDWSVDVICGGFPCQDISLASSNGVGIIGERSGLWGELARIVGVIRPRFVVVENVPALRGRGLALVLQDLRALGFDAEWHCLPACAFGAPHERDRIWIVAYAAGLFRETIIRGQPDGHLSSDAADADGFGCEGRTEPNDEGHREALAERESARRDAADAASNGRGQGRARGPDSDSSREQSDARSASDSDSQGPSLGQSVRCDNGAEQSPLERSLEDVADAYDEPLVWAAIARGERHAWTAQPGVVRMVHGVPGRVDRLAALGNAIVPQVAEWIGRQIIKVTT